MKLKPGQKVEVIWQDAIAEAKGWSRADDFDFDISALAGRMTTLGHFVRFKRGYIFIAQSYRPPDGMFCSTMSIPVSCVTRIKKIGKRKSRGV